MLIDIEGTDGSGKKTQTKLLFDYLNSLGYKCKMISFPNYESNSSALVKMYLNGEFKTNLTGYQASVFYAADRLATMSQINIDDYDYVLFDRYVPSNMIHQSTVMDTIEEVDKFLDWCVDFEYNLLKLPKPDINIFLDVPVEISLSLARARENLKNGQTKDILEADDQHMQKAYLRAKHVANRFDWTSIDCSKDGKIKTIEQIHKEILTKLNLNTKI